MSMNDLSEPSKVVTGCPTPSNNPWLVTRPGNGLVTIRHASIQTVEPSDWLDILGSFIRRLPRVQVVGAKRYFVDGHVFSLGENLIHPKGFHHHGKGVHSQCYRFPEEVDTLCGGVMVVQEAAFDAVKGDAILSAMPELGPTALGLAIRLKGGLCLAVPQVVITDEFSPDPKPAEAAVFRDKFGFDWLAPDMRDVYARHEGTELLWNVSFHAGMMPFEKYDQRGALVWEGYSKAPHLKQRCDYLAKMVKEFAANQRGPVLDTGCGDGLFSHLFAMQGLEVLGIDPEPRGVAVRSPVRMRLPNAQHCLM
jgi:hypothetical protein